MPVHSRFLWLIARRPLSVVARFLPSWRIMRQAQAMTPMFAGGAAATQSQWSAREPVLRWRDTMVFRKESRADSFQRQISALRQQLGSDQDDDLYPVADDATPMPPAAPPPDLSATPTRIVTPPAGDDALVGVIAANSHWNGTLRSDGSLRVLGRVEGELQAADEIYVAEGATVTARVSASHVIIAGMVNGTVECTSRLEILPSGHVVGDVTSPTLIVHEGATVEGDLSMRAPAARPA